MDSTSALEAKKYGNQPICASKETKGKKFGLINKLR